ncbi:MAG TPA: acetate--CoA ligase family protein [Ktedonobacteraceae bacterium]
MLAELRGGPLLQGARGQAPVNIEKLADVIFGITQLAQDLQEDLELLEINPCCFMVKALKRWTF